MQIHDTIWDGAYVCTGGGGEGGLVLEWFCHFMHRLVPILRDGNYPSNVQV